MGFLCILIEESVYFGGILCMVEYILFIGSSVSSETSVCALK